VPVIEQNPSVGMVFTGLNWIIQNAGKTNAMLPYSEDWVVDGKLFRANLVRNCVAYGPTILARKECYEKLGPFFTEMRIHNDWEMWTRLASHYDIGYVSKLLSNALRHPENLTTASRSDTRMPDDFTAWLRGLETGKLPYQLSSEERNNLEAAMIVMVRALFFASARHRNRVTATACAEFLFNRPLVPWYEKLRYRLAVYFLNRFPSLTSLVLHSRGITEKGWNLAPWLSLKIPAKDPVDALMS
jgi:hypothetical protein